MPRPLRPQDVALFRQRLCEAAERLFAEGGEPAVTMRNLAHALGVSPMTPYSYYKDKDEILAAIRAAAFTRFAVALETAFAKSDDPLTASLLTGQAYIDFALSEPASYRLMFDLAQPEEGGYPELAVAAQRARATMRAHVEKMIAADMVEGDADLLGHVFWAALHGALVLEMAGKLGAGVDPVRLRAVIMTAVSRGLGIMRRVPLQAPVAG